MASTHNLIFANTTGLRGSVDDSSPIMGWWVLGFEYRYRAPSLGVFERRNGFMCKTTTPFNKQKLMYVSPFVLFMVIMVVHHGDQGATSFPN